MRKIAAIAFGLGAAVFGSSANAAIAVDGAYDADYGLPTAAVLYDPAAPTSNFGTPGPTTSGLAYNIYLKDEGGTIYGLLQGNGLGGTSAGSFANLYFGVNGSGSILGFQLGGTSPDAFIPSTGAMQSVPISVATTANSLEFALPESYFESAIGSLPTAGANPGDTVTLRLSQAFGYSVAGGATYGPNRLGTVTLSGGTVAVPGPIAGAGLVPILGLAGAWFMRRRKQLAA